MLRKFFLILGRRRFWGLMVLMTFFLLSGWGPGNKPARVRAQAAASGARVVLTGNSLAERALGTLGVQNAKFGARFGLNFHFNQWWQPFYDWFEATGLKDFGVTQIDGYGTREMLANESYPGEVAETVISGKRVFFRYPLVEENNYYKFMEATDWFEKTGLAGFGVAKVDAYATRVAMRTEEEAGQLVEMVVAGEDLYYRYPYVAEKNRFVKMANWLTASGLVALGVTKIDGYNYREAVEGEDHAGDLIESVNVGADVYYKYPLTAGETSWHKFANSIEATGLAQVGITKIDAYATRYAVGEEPYANERFYTEAQSLMEVVISGTQMWVKFPKTTQFANSIFSSSLGTGYDRIFDYRIGTKIDGQSLYFPPTEGVGLYPQTKLELGLTYLAEKSSHGSLTVSRKIVSPFFKTESLNDPLVKALAGPFIYEVVTVKNNGSAAQAFELIGSLPTPASTGETANYKIVYFSHDRDGGGKRAVVLPKTPVTPTVSGNNFSYALNLVAGKEAEVIIIHASYTDFTVVKEDGTNKEFGFYYRLLFPGGITEVIDYAWTNRELVLQKTEETEQVLSGSSVSGELKFFLAQAAHSYIGNTFLLVNKKDSNEMRFYVTEGANCCGILSTIDVAHEYAAFEAYFFPWALKMELKEWLNARFLVNDATYGLYASHDMGLFHFDTNAATLFNKVTVGTAVPRLKMEVEENANLVLMLWFYWKTAGKNEALSILESDGNLADVKALLQSMIKRDDPADDAQDGTGYGLADVWTYATFDTYSLFPAAVLGHSKDNTYMGVKQMAAYLAGSELFSKVTKDEAFSQILTAEAQKIAETLVAYAQSHNGKIPLSLDPEYASREADSPVLLDGLFYLTLGKMKSPILEKVMPFLKTAAVASLEELTETYGVTMNKQKYSAGERSWDQYWPSKVVNTEAVLKRAFGVSSNRTGTKAFEVLQRTLAAYVDSLHPLTGWPSRPLIEEYPYETVALNYYPRGVSSLALLPEVDFCNQRYDFDDDCDLDRDDVWLLLKNWGAGGVVMDVNGDGKVNGVDLAQVLMEW